jgi:hypothetical protein
MNNDDRLEQLRYKGEGADLDFKQAQYRFIGVSDHEKCELLKDILAMANAYRSGPGYILIGFKDQPPLPAKLIGISPLDHIDDAALQQFVNSKVEPKLNFSYEERLFGGKTVAIITIPKQQRPFYLTKDYGKLSRSVVYVRRGSSTDEASPKEVSKMGLDDNEKNMLRVELSIQDEQNRLLSNHFDLSFLHIDEELPNYEINEMMDRGDGVFATLPSLVPTNHDYWRDGAEYLSAMGRLIQIRLCLTNRSDFSLTDAKLEVTCVAPDGQPAVMMRAGYLPEEPHTNALRSLRLTSKVLERTNERIAVDHRGGEPVCHIRLGTLLPGEVGRAQDDLAVLPTGPGNYTLRVRIMAGEISPPIAEEHAMQVSGAVCKMRFDDLVDRISAAHLSDESNASQ